jgi:membrane-bound lytic murein transglycosylase D
MPIRILSCLRNSFANIKKIITTSFTPTIFILIAFSAATSAKAEISSPPIPNAYSTPDADDLSDTNQEYIAPSELTSDPIGLFINNLDASDSTPIVQDENLWQRIKDGYAMPDIESSHTATYEQWYASRPDYVKRMLERSQKYLFHIVEEVEKRGMPTEIALLPMIESAYNPQAYSKSHASGIWQFVPATGKDFGLKQNYWTDKRRDVTAATNAALTYLQKLYGMFGAWDLALAAYNAGEGTVSRAIERNKRKGLPTDYQSLDLPSETKDYVPKLQAIKNIITEPEQFGLELNDIPNKPYFTRVAVPNQIDAKIAAKLARISDEEFIALNPSYNKPIVVSNNDTHQILLPTWSVATFQDNLANYDKPLTTWKTYTAKRGERISYIAKKFNIGAGQLRKVNDLGNTNKIRATRPLLVPNNGTEQAKITLASFNRYHQHNSEPTHKKTIRYKVKRGDTLSELASKFNLSIQEIAKSNRIKNNHLRVGQVIYFNRYH